MENNLHNDTKIFLDEVFINYFSNTTQFINNEFKRNIVLISNESLANPKYF